MRKLVLATLAAGIWVNVNEFLRNELLLKRVWVDKFDSLGLLFPAEPVNGALWVLWGFIFAACIVAVARNSTFVSATALSWVFGFVLMWIVIALRAPIGRAAGAACLAAYAAYIAYSLTPYL